MNGDPCSERARAGDCGWWAPSAGRCSHRISDSVHRRCSVCHGDRLADVFLVPGPGRLGGRPGPPGLPRRARVGPTTGSAARMKRREGLVPAAADPFPSGGLGVRYGGDGGSDVAVVVTGPPGPSLVAASGSGSSIPSYQEMGDSSGSGSSPDSGSGDATFSSASSASVPATRYACSGRGRLLAGLPARGLAGLTAGPFARALAGPAAVPFSGLPVGLFSGPFAGERRNQPASGATPGQSLSFTASAAKGMTSVRGCAA
jgi:hypothetical protein